MTAAIYIRMQSRSQQLIKKYGGKYSWGTGGIIGRDAQGNEVFSGGDSNSTGWAILKDLDRKFWGDEREPGEAELTFAPLGADGKAVSFTNDMVIDSVFGQGKFRVVDVRPVAPDGTTMMVSRVRVKAL